MESRVMTNGLAHGVPLLWLSVACGGLTFGCGDAGQGLRSVSQPTDDTASEAVNSPPTRLPHKDWVSRAGERIEVGTYRFSADGNGFRGYSAEEGLRARFDTLGAHISSEVGGERNGDVTLRFAAWGRAGAERQVGAAEPSLGACNEPERVDEHGECLQRVERVHDGIVEWWDNSSRGLQQAWTIGTKPAGTGAIQLMVDVEGATASSGAGNVVSLRQADGSVIDYDDLNIVDADGVALEGTLRAEPGRIIISFDDRGARYPITVDPTAAMQWRPGITPQAGSYFGLHMTGLGDVNGDGIEDFAIAAHAYSGAQQFSGKVFVYYGRQNYDFSWSGPLSSPSWETTGTREMSGLGADVAAGDFNGDGYRDLAVGEVPYSTVYIFFGSSSGLGNTPGWSATSGLVDDGFGWSLASAGDVNGDGRSDLLVGAPFASLPETEEGLALLYLGKSSNMSTTPAWTQTGDSVGARLGFSVAGVGDVNGDGRADAVVGGPGYGGKGKAWGYLGTVSGLSNAVWSPEGTQAGEEFGFNVEAAGDENADGYADVLVGAPNYDSGSNVDVGRLFLYSSSASGFAVASLTEVGTLANGKFGEGLSAAGDINGDGKADFLRGSVNGGNWVGGVRYGHGAYPAESDYNDAYAVQTEGVGDVDNDGFADGVFANPWANSNAGDAQLWGGRPALPSTTAIDPTRTDRLANTQFGIAVTDAGDVNGDGYGDLLVGANQDRGNSAKGTGGGRAYVYFGNGALATWTAGGGQNNAHLGSALASCDFDNDGYSDVAISSPEHDTTQTDAGRVTIYYGSATGIRAGSTILQAEQASAQFGAALAAGDTNGDGYCDLAVGAPLFDNGQTDEGRVFLYRGLSTGLSSTYVQSLENDVAGSLFGSALSFGEVNHDGQKDLAVGAKGYSNGEAGEGRAYVYLVGANGVFGSPSWSAESDSVGASFGAALAMSVDFNQGGTGDLVVSAPTYVANGWAGRLYYYKWSGTTFVHQESQPGVATAIATGDIDGNGFGDVVFGSASGVRLRMGNKDFVASDWLPTFACAAGDSACGRSVALSDLNGDGSSDISAGLVMNTGVGGVRTWRLENGGANLQVLRPGTTTPIAPGGKAMSAAVDVRLFARTPHGRMRVKLEVEMIQSFGVFSSSTIARSSTWSDTGVSGTWLTLPVTGLAANAKYSYRARVQYQPVLGFGAMHSRWYYGGNKGDANGVHFRTP